MPTLVDTQHVKYKCDCSVAEHNFYFQTMSDKEKTRFHQMAEKDKKRYESEMANYKPSDKAKGKGAKGGKRKRTKDPNAPKRALYVF